MAVLPFENRKLNGAVDRWRRFVAGFTPGQKTVTVLATLAVLVGGIFFVTHSSAPSYTVLFSNLQASDAGQITQQLNTNHVPYELSDGGSTILVPSGDVNQERISLAEAGLPNGGTITFQTLASTGITSSQFVQDVDYQQALAAQLEETIGSIQGVQSAKVSLVVPQQSTFAVTNTTNPSASVLVALDPGVTLTSTQVQAIVHLTASAVPDLSPSNVTVADSNGDVLSAPGVDQAASTDDQQTAAWDQEVAAKITALLTPVVGADNAAVQVNDTLNFNQQSQTTNSFVLGPNGKPLVVPTSSSTTRQNFTGNGQNAAGTLGSGTPPTSSNQNGTYSNTQSSSSNAVGSVTSTVQQAPGQVIAASVAVLLNSSAKGVSTPRTLAQIKSLVTAAAGLNLKSPNDQLVVSALPFAPSPQTQTAAPKASMLNKLKGAAPAGGLVVLVLVLFLGALIVSKRRTPKFEEIPLSQLGAGDHKPALGPASGELSVLDTGEIPAIPLGAGMNASLLPAVGTVPADVDTYIRENPGEVAQLMRNWSREKVSRPAVGSRT
jgi:flagellar M-ring protein FliF